MLSILLSQKINIGPTGSTTEIEGPIEGINTLGDLVNKIMEYLIPFASIILLVVLVWGGFDYLMSKGEPNGLKAGKAKITAGIIGFVLLAASYILVKLITAIIGIGDGII